MNTPTFGTRLTLPPDRPPRPENTPYAPQRKEISAPTLRAAPQSPANTGISTSLRGSRTQLELAMEPDEDGCDVVAVWDVERLRRAGALPADSSAVAVAALESGLVYRVLALQEHRSRPDNRRTSLTVVLFAEDFVRLSQASARRYHRPKMKERRRIVLLADGSPEIRWWDSAADKGPAEIEDLPLSPQLVDELSALRLALEKLHEKKMRSSYGCERYELEMELDELNELAESLWRRARAELVRDYVVGFIGRGMNRPVWSPRDLDDPTEDDELLEL